MTPAQLHFSLQAGCPEVEQARDRRAPDIAAAVQAIFPMDTEDAVLTWNRVPVLLSYKYDLSVMVSDLLPLLREIATRPAGTHGVYWASDTFRAEWFLRWGEPGLAIDSRWHSVTGRYESLLNSRPTVELPRATFQAAWAPVLRRIDHAIDQSGIDVVARAELDDLREASRPH